MPGELTSVPARFIVPAVTEPGYPTLTFEQTSPVQSDFLGIGADNMAFVEFPELALTAPQKLTEYDRTYTSGMRISRAWVGPWWADPSWPNGTRDWNATKMGYFYTWLTNQKSRGIKVVLTLGWHFPNNLCSIDSGGITPVCTPTVPQENNWAAWISELLHQTMNVRAYDNIIAGFFFTEPSTSTGPIPGGYGSAQEYYAHLITVARAKIVTDDAGRIPILPRIKLMGTEENSFTDPTWLQYIKANADAQVDAYDAHSYELSPPFPPLALAANEYPTYAAAVARFTAWKGYASPKPFWVDEGPTVVGGDTDSFGYRRTADAGFTSARKLVIHMQSGAQASLIWTFHDEHFEDAAGYAQQYGIKDWPSSLAVKPSWYAVTMLANLCGGGNGTKIYAMRGETTELHGVAVFIPNGDRWSTSAAGDWTFIVVNDSAAPTPINVRFMSTLNRTFYRYTYSGEIPPRDAADVAYLLPWDMRFANAVDRLPRNTVPARSVVCYSTINMAAGQENLSLSATVSTDSTGFGQASNTIDGNFSNVIGTLNGWRKADNASHFLRLSWGSQQQNIGRVELAFAGNTTGVVWGNWDASTPTILADYMLQYWTGVRWDTLVTVTGNTSANRTHTFPSVTTNMFQIVVTSAAASANLNQFATFT